MADGRRTDIVEAANQNARDLAKDDGVVCAAAEATAAVRFAIGGRLRFLSHAETLRVFQRACARAGVPVKFTEGFNPHPKLSLPLPRPVGVESADELLVLRLSDERGIPADEAAAPARRAWQDRTQKSLAAQLPQDIELWSVDLRRASASFVAESADYVFAVRAADDSDLAARRQQRITDLLARESIVIERASPNRPGRRIDVRGFLKSIRTEAGRLVATCVISAGGSIRVDEIMQLLDLTVADLAGPVRRAKVAWKTT